MLAKGLWHYSTRWLALKCDASVLFSRWHKWLAKWKPPLQRQKLGADDSACALLKESQQVRVSSKLHSTATTSFDLLVTFSFLNFRYFWKNSSSLVQFSLLWHEHSITTVHNQKCIVVCGTFVRDIPSLYNLGARSLHNWLCQIAGMAKGTKMK